MRICLFFFSLLCFIVFAAIPSHLSKIIEKSITEKTTTMAGDDLDDGLEYEFDAGPDAVSLAPDAGDENEIFDQEESDISKSKFSDKADSDATEKKDSENPKKRKHKSSLLAEKKRMKMEMDMEQKRTISKELSTEVIADYINGRIAQKNRNLSSLELSELYLPKECFRSTSDFDKDETPRNLDNLSKFITNRFKNMLPSKLKQSKATKDTKKADTERKFIAIVSMSAIRACDIHRATRDLSGSSLKIINKNKLDVDLDLVLKTKSRVLCCTPGRLSKVLNAENLPLRWEEIKIIIVDNSYLDKKSQNVWDINETPKVLKTLVNAGSKIYFY